MCQKQRGQGEWGLNLRWKNGIEKVVNAWDLNIHEGTKCAWDGLNWSDVVFSSIVQSVA